MSNDMSTTARNEITILGGGPAGMAAALALIKAGFQVVIYERYPEARPAGNILNLWPPPIKALKNMGVDIDDLGAPCHTSFRNVHGKIRADINIPQEVIDEYGGGFIGLLRPDLYTRMLEAIPPGVLQVGREVTKIDDHGDGITMTFADGAQVETSLLIGADGIDSTVRKHLWGLAPKRPHNLHIIGGFTFDDSVPVEPNECVLVHNSTIQGTYTSIRSKGRTGYQWWMLEAWPDTTPAPEDLHQHALTMVTGFPAPLEQLIKATPPTNLQRWPIRDLVPLKQWSKGRITLAGDAAHATSPYAAYGAGMSICDGYFLGQCLYKVNLQDTAAVTAALVDYENRRIAHTTEQVESAYMLGKLFHHTPSLFRFIRDIILDYTSLLQRQVGERNPREITQQLKEMGPDLFTKAKAIPLNEA